MVRIERGSEKLIYFIFLEGYIHYIPYMNRVHKKTGNLPGTGWHHLNLFKNSKGLDLNFQETLVCVCRPCCRHA